MLCDDGRRTCSSHGKDGAENTQETSSASLKGHTLPTQECKSHPRFRTCLLCLTRPLDMDFYANCKMRSISGLHDHMLTFRCKHAVQICERSINIHLHTFIYISTDIHRRVVPAFKGQTILNIRKERWVHRNLRVVRITHE